MSVRVDIKKCVGCGLCVSLCPVKAISIVQNKAFIDLNKCLGCLQCMEECPENAIREIPEKHVPLAKRESFILSPMKRNAHQTGQAFSENRWIAHNEKRSRTLLGAAKRVIESVVVVDSSFGARQEGGRGQRRGKGRRHRGGRG